MRWEGTTAKITLRTIKTRPVSPSSQARKQGCMKLLSKTEPGLLDNIFPDQLKEVASPLFLKTQKNLLNNETHQMLSVSTAIKLETEGNHRLIQAFIDVRHFSHFFKKNVQTKQNNMQAYT